MFDKFFHRSREFQMATSDRKGANWTDHENDLIVADHFEMVRKGFAGERPVKARHNEELQRLTGRTQGSIEYKHRNVSAVLRKLGYQWVPGYIPASHFQKSIVEAVDRFLSSAGFPTLVPDLPNRQAAEIGPLYVGPAPVLQHTADVEPQALRRLVSKFDPAARDARNRALGKKGEELALIFEENRLRAAGRDDLARKINWVSQTIGDGEGYDILSYAENGQERLLEVKTTIGYELTPFFLSANESALSEERPRHFRIFRIYDVARDPKAFEIVPPLRDALNLRTANYRASFD